MVIAIRASATKGSASRCRRAGTAYPGLTTMSVEAPTGSSGCPLDPRMGYDCIGCEPGVLLEFFEVKAGTSSYDGDCAGQVEKMTRRAEARTEMGQEYYADKGHCKSMRQPLWTPLGSFGSEVRWIADNEWCDPLTPADEPDCCRQTKETGRWTPVEEGCYGYGSTENH